MAGSGSVQLDDVLFYPSNASVSHQTYNPIFGVTSLSDVNGRIIYTEYDELGRKSSILDQDRNLIEKYNYSFYRDTPPSLKAIFTRSETRDKYIVGDTETFTAGAICHTAGYEWFVNDEPQGTGTTLSYTFSEFASYHVSLLVTDQATGATADVGVTYYTVPSVLSATLFVTDEAGAEVTGTSTMGKCAQDEGTFERNFEVKLTGACGGRDSELTYEWVYLRLDEMIEKPVVPTAVDDGSFHFKIDDQQIDEVPDTGGGTQGTNFNYAALYGQSFIIRCKVREICRSGGVNGFEVDRTIEVDHTVIYEFENNCQ